MFSYLLGIGCVFMQEKINTEIKGYLAILFVAEPAESITIMKKISSIARMDLMKKCSTEYSLCFLEDEIKDSCFELLDIFYDNKEFNSLYQWICILGWIASRHVRSLMMYNLASIKKCQEYIKQLFKLIGMIKYDNTEHKLIKQSLLLFYKNVLWIEEYKPLFEDYQKKLEEVKELQFELLQTAKNKDDIFFALQNIMCFLSATEDALYIQKMVNALTEKYYSCKGKSTKAKIAWELLNWTVEKKEAKTEGITQVLLDYSNNGFYTNNTAHIERMYSQYKQL